MKTDNFKMSFVKSGDFRYTLFTFGYTEVTVYCYPAQCIDELDEYAISYKNNGKLKLSLSSFNQVDFVRDTLHRLFYGFLDYTNVRQVSLPIQIISDLRCLMNYCKRANIKMV